MSPGDAAPREAGRGAEGRAAEGRAAEGRVGTRFCPGAAPGSDLGEAVGARVLEAGGAPWD